MSIFRAVNEENNEANNIKNRLTNEWGKVPDTARYYKVKTKSNFRILKVNFIF